MLKKWAPLVLSLTIAVILAVLAITPPAPKGIDTHADEFSSGRAMKDVRIIAAKPHPTGSEENRIVREYLLKRLDALGAMLGISMREKAILTLISILAN